MSRLNKIVTSQVDSSTDTKHDENTYSYDSNGILVRHDADRVGKSVVGPGVLYGANKDNSDQTGLNTIKLIPNEDLQSDQFLIIEPTQPGIQGAPGHIHLRAGGTQDDSNADLILGGERNSVVVSDTEKEIKVSTAFRSKLYFTNLNSTSGTEFIVAETANILVGDRVYVGNNSESYIVDAITVDQGLATVTANGASFGAGAQYLFTREEAYNSQWLFGSDGVLSGPSMGGLIVNALVGTQTNDLYIYSPNDDVVIESISGDIILSPDSGAYLYNSLNPENQIATLGNIGVDTPFTVVGGTAGDQPEFDGAPLFTGSYIRSVGGLVHFRIDVNMDNITDFGTGQYYVDLPFPAKYNYHFRDACLHDNSGTVRQYALSGHIYATQSRVTLWFTATSGQDEAFDYNSPALLTVADNFHISGTYIVDTAAP